MDKKAHLDLTRSGLFVSEIADAEREREKFLHLSFNQRNLKDSRYERNYFVKAKDILDKIYVDFLKNCRVAKINPLKLYFM